jgi:ElaB/YqjD/DUF883 family membrane-anchored ribosome-binding protein
MRRNIDAQAAFQGAQQDGRADLCALQQRADTMADDTAPKAPQTRTANTSGAKKPGTAAKPRKPAAATSKPKAKRMTQTTTPNTATGASTHRNEAKSRFNAAVNEAKAGAAALRAEATERAGVYRDQAGKKRQDWMTEAKTYSEDAKVKGRDLAAQGKGKVSEGLTALGQAVGDSAQVVDEKLGAKYGDYARTASRSLQDAATKLEQKSVEDLGEDAREFVRKSPGTAVGIAAVFGFLLSRLFRR